MLLLGAIAAVGILAVGSSPARQRLALAFAALLTAVAAYVLHRLFLALRGTPSPWSYRSAFIIAAVTSMAVLGAGARGSGFPVAAIALTLGAFAGGLAASWRDDGLWEDNSPPPSDVVRFVYETHRSRYPAEAPTPAGKRLLDLAASSAGLVVLSPLAITIGLLLWLEDPGPLFFVKNSVGRGGRSFRQWKLRTMVRGAEAESGPVWAEKEDERVLRSGKLLRRTALDELPQLVNILVGQMSVVGPRPQRTVLVAEYLRGLPAYADRHRLPPGLAGLAQVAGHYYITPRQKLRFDRLYLEHAGLGFDLKLLLIAFAVVFWLRWRPGWRGRLPRAWLHRRPTTARRS
jgi:lipopolysaccharide/colanic/teichoic acid biosynthesis glycosyltransferase